MTAYEKDFNQWAHEQASLIRNGKFNELDRNHLIEEIERLSGSDKRALRSYLRILLVHLLKIKYQSEKRTRSWDASVLNSRREIALLLKDNPSFRKLLPEYIYNSYEIAVTEASIETGLEEKAFPTGCPWSIEEVLGKKF